MQAALTPPPFPGGRRITWTHVETAQLTMRAFSPEFVGHLAAIDAQAFETPGAYQLDRVGLQLFDRIKGDYFTTLGAPILLLFARLREIGHMAS